MQSKVGQYSVYLLIFPSFILLVLLVRLEIDADLFHLSIDLFKIFEVFSVALTFLINMLQWIYRLEYFEISVIEFVKIDLFILLIYFNRFYHTNKILLLYFSTVLPFMMTEYFDLISTVKLLL